MSPVHRDKVDRAISAVSGKVGEDTRQESSELGLAHLAGRHGELAVLDRAQAANMAVDLHVVRRVGEDHLRPHAPEQVGIGGRGSGIPTDEPVPADLPDIAQSGDGRTALIDIGDLVSGIRLARHNGCRAKLADQDVDLRHRKAGDRHLEVEVEFGEILKVDRQQLPVPAGLFGDAVVCNHIGADLGLAHVCETDRRHGLEAELLGRLDPAMAGNDAIIAIDQHRVRKTELPDGVDDLADLRLGVRTRIARPRRQSRGLLVDDAKVGHSRLPVSGARKEISAAPEIKSEKPR
jgi:hypothetical protein